MLRTNRDRHADSRIDLPELPTIASSPASSSDLFADLELLVQSPHEDASLDSVIQLLDNRLYLAQRVLPLLVPALDRLVKVADAKGSVGPSKPPSNSISARLSPLRRFRNDASVEEFNPIIWLGQYLFRHNPPDATERRSSSETAYLETLKRTATSLQSRVHHLRACRDSTRRFEVLLDKLKGQAEQRFEVIKNAVWSACMAALERGTDGKSPQVMKLFEMHHLFHFVASDPSLFPTDASSSHLQSILAAIERAHMAQVDTDGDNETARTNSRAWVAHITPDNFAHIIINGTGAGRTSPLVTCDDDMFLSFVRTVVDTLERLSDGSHQATATTKERLSVALYQMKGNMGQEWARGMRKLVRAWAEKQELTYNATDVPEVDAKAVSNDVDHYLEGSSDCDALSILLLHSHGTKAALSLAAYLEDLSAHGGWEAFLEEAPGTSHRKVQETLPEPSKEDEGQRHEEARAKLEYERRRRVITMETVFGTMDKGNIKSVPFATLSSIFRRALSPDAQLPPHVASVLSQLGDLSNENENVTKDEWVVHALRAIEHAEASGVFVDLEGLASGVQALVNLEEAASAPKLAPAKRKVDVQALTARLSAELHTLASTMDMTALSFAQRAAQMIGKALGKAGGAAASGAGVRVLVKDTQVHGSDGREGLRCIGVGGDVPDPEEYRDQHLGESYAGGNGSFEYDCFANGVVATGQVVSGSFKVSSVAVPMEGLGCVVVDVFGEAEDTVDSVDEGRDIAKHLSSTLAACLHSIDARFRSLSLAASAREYMQATHPDMGVDVFVVDREGGELWRVAEMDEEVDWAAGGMEAWGAGGLKLERVKKDATNAYLFQSATTNAKVASTGTPPLTAIPVVDPQASGPGSPVAAVVSLRGSGGAPLGEDDIKDVEQMGAILGQGFAVVNGTEPSEGGSTQNLDGEKFSTLAQRALLFGKLVLKRARKLLSQIDTATLSELKSYKKPPALVHTIMKCVLFVFGKTEDNVKGWGETAKMLNVELLKKMQAYDPTVVQKKKRFDRIRKLLSTIKTDDIRKHASLPTQLMHNWLIVSLALRDKAVKERKRLKEAPSSGTLGSMDDGGDDEDDSVLDGGVDAGTD